MNIKSILSVEFIKKSRLLGAAGAVAVSMITATANAAVIWDYSPETTGASLSSSWNNDSCCQNFGEQVSFSDPVRLDGMDIYSEEGWGTVGTPVVVRIWSDVAGLPGTLMHEFKETLSIIDKDGAIHLGNVRKHADFTTSIVLNANTNYWIGMSGDSSQGFNDIKQSGLLGGVDDSSMATFSGTTFDSMSPTHVGDMAFRLHGAVVPLPPAVYLFGSGILGLVGLARRKQSV